MLNGGVVLLFAYLFLLKRRKAPDFCIRMMHAFILIRLSITRPIYEKGYKPLTTSLSYIPSFHAINNRFSLTHL